MSPKLIQEKYAKMVAALSSADNMSAAALRADKNVMRSALVKVYKAEVGLDRDRELEFYRLWWAGQELLGQAIRAGFGEEMQLQFWIGGPTFGYLKSEGIIDADGVLQPCTYAVFAKHGRCHCFQRKDGVDTYTCPL